MAVDLSGVQAKHERTLALLRELQAQVSAFLARHPYVVIGNFDETTRTIEAIFTVREQPPVDWGTLIGDILHNLRSSLDQLVWQLVVHETRADPTSNRTQFPIFLHEAGFKERAGQMMVGLSDSTKSLIDRGRCSHGSRDPGW